MSSICFSSCSSPAEISTVLCTNDAPTIGSKLFLVSMTFLDNFFVDTGAPSSEAAACDPETGNRAFPNLKVACEGVDRAFGRRYTGTWIAAILRSDKLLAGLGRAQAILLSRSTQSHVPSLLRVIEWVTVFVLEDGESY